MTLLPANQSDSAAARKLAIFLVYAAHDSHVCQTAATCSHDRRYWSWMSRTYEVPAPSASTVAAAQPAVDGRASRVSAQRLLPGATTRPSTRPQAPLAAHRLDAPSW